MKSIIGRKIGMTEVYAEDGTMYAVTVVEVLPNVVTYKKTIEKDGYQAVQVGYEDKKEKNLTKAMKGIYKKANVATKANLYELKGDEVYSFEVGQEIKCDLFKKGDVVDVIGTSKGHGFAGTVKRWHHTIGPKGHGSGYHRGQGSFANNGRCNNRVIPGKKMSGHMGVKQATVLNARVIDVNLEKNYILISGGVPGSKYSIVKIRSAIKTVKNAEVIKPLLDRAAFDKAEAEKLAAETAAKEAAKVAAKEKAEAEKKAKEDAKAAKKAAKVAAQQAASEAPAEEKPAEEAAPVAEENKAE